VLSKRRLFDKKIKMAAQYTTNKVATLIKEYTNHEYVYATLLGVAGIFTILTFGFPLITQV
jgi:hypothetical protein